jgi:hypothetical protein
LLNRVVWLLSAVLRFVTVYLTFLSHA